MNLFILRDYNKPELFACFMLCFLCACSPVYRTFEAVLEGSAECISDAKRRYSACKASLAYEFDQCMTNKEMLHQLELSNWNSEKALLHSEIDHCIDKCRGRTHSHDGEKLRNDYKYCVSCKGPCDYIEWKANSITGRPTSPSTSECAYIYQSCDNEYALIY